MVAVITTDAEGVAETGWLTWGTCRVTESKVPEHFVDAGFSADIVIDEENFKTCELEVENEPTKGFIRLTKTDRANGNPIAGVKFDIYENDEYGNALVADMTTGKDGAAVSPPLRKGRYIVRERGAAAGSFRHGGLYIRRADSRAELFLHTARADKNFHADIRRGRNADESRAAFRLRICGIFRGGVLHSLRYPAEQGLRS